MKQKSLWFATVSHFLQSPDEYQHSNGCKQEHAVLLKLKAINGKMSTPFSQCFSDLSVLTTARSSSMQVNLHSSAGRNIMSNLLNMCPLWTKLLPEKRIPAAEGCWMFSEIHFLKWKSYSFHMEKNKRGTLSFVQRWDSDCI